jgi:hypothetical protein
MQHGPPPHWSQPPAQHPQAPQWQQPNPYVPPPPSWFQRYWWLFALAGIPAIIGLTLLGVRADEASNYVLFDSPDAEVSVRVDGHVLQHDGQKRIGPKIPGLFGGRGPLLDDMEAGTHKIEILDAKGAVIETAEIVIPKSGYRAVYTVGKPRRYTFVSVSYGGTLDGPERAPLTPGPSPHLSIFPAAPVTRKQDFDTINRKFPSSLSTKSRNPVLRGLCSVTDDDDLECEIEQAEEKPKKTRH